MASIIPDPEQLRFEQRCLEHFERQARALEQRFNKQKESLTECQEKLVQAEEALEQQKLHQLQVDGLVAETRTRIVQLEHFELQARHSFKTQFKLAVKEVIRRLQRRSVEQS